MHALAQLQFVWQALSKWHFTNPECILSVQFTYRQVPCGLILPISTSPYIRGNFPEISLEMQFGKLHPNQFFPKMMYIVGSVFTNSGWSPSLFPKHHQVTTPQSRYSSLGGTPPIQEAKQGPQSPHHPRRLWGWWRWPYPDDVCPTTTYVGFPTTAH